MENKIVTVSELRKFAQGLLEGINSVAKNTDACVIAFYGELGSGKTTLVQNIANELGVIENVTSPTYVLQKTYKINHSKFSRLIHIDAYRIDSDDEILHLGWQKIVNNSENLIVVEWADKIERLLPTNTKKLFLTFLDDKTRKIQW